jgi:hypothetical protein
MGDQPVQRQSSRPGKHGPEPRALGERFWEKVDRHGPDECWPWIAARFAGKDYGAFRVGGQQRRAHRVAYELTHGPIASHQLVCHSCDNPCCCNPSHLWLGSHADNHADRNRKERQAKGERSGMRLHPWKLSPQQADEIRRLRGQEYQRETAHRYGVSQSMVWKIQTGLSWDPH